MSTKATQVPDKDFNTLSDAGNAQDSDGLYSDGSTMWVVDTMLTDKIYVYNARSLVNTNSLNSILARLGLPEIGAAPNLIVNMNASSTNVAPSDTITLTATVSNTGRGSSTASTLRWYRSTDSTITTADTQVGTNVLSSLEAGGRITETISITVPNTSGTYYYGVCVDRVTGEIETNNNCSSAVRLVVTPAPDLIVTNMMVSATSADTSGPITLTATVSNRGIRISDSTTLRWYRSSDGIITTNDTEVGTSSLSSLGVGGSRTISITITNNIGTYHGACVDSVTNEINTNNNCSSAINVLVTSATRVSSNDYTLAGANGEASGIFTDNTTLWVVNAGNVTVEQTKIFAYSIRTTHRVNAREFNTLGSDGATRARGLWSDSTFMWVADWLDDKIYAYNMKSKARVPNRDFNTLSNAGNTQPEGIWSDRTTMWVADQEDDKIFAYNMRTKARDSAKDFNTLAGAGNSDPRGIWSDGTTMWVYDTGDSKFYAYDMESKVRVPPKEFAGSQFSTFICSDGNTMWLGNYIFDKVYAYDLRESVNTALINTNR